MVGKVGSGGIPVLLMSDFGWDDTLPAGTPVQTAVKAL